MNKLHTLLIYRRSWAHLTPGCYFLSSSRLCNPVCDLPLPDFLSTSVYSCSRVWKESFPVVTSGLPQLPATWDRRLLTPSWYPP